LTRGAEKKGKKRPRGRTSAEGTACDMPRGGTESKKKRMPRPEKKKKFVVLADPREEGGIVIPPFTQKEQLKKKKGAVRLRAAQEGEKKEE